MLPYIFCTFVFYLMVKKFMSLLTIGKYGDRYVLVTGCDSGFGNFLAQRLDDMGFRVFAGCLTITGAENLKRSCSDRLKALELDVTKDDSIQDCFEDVKRALPKDKGLWAVVNNAGNVRSFGPTAWLTRKDYDDTMAVNLFGLISITTTFLPLVLIEKGRVVNMTSVLGRFPCISTAYAVSKAAAEAFSDVLRQELYNQDASVHIIEPGFFATPLNATFPDIVHAKVASLPSEVKRELPPNFEEICIKGFQKKIQEWSDPDLNKVVNAYVHAISARFPKARYLVGTDANFKFRVLMHLPEWLSDYFVSRMVKP